MELLPLYQSVASARRGFTVCSIDAWTPARPAVLRTCAEKSYMPAAIQVLVLKEMAAAK